MKLEQCYRINQPDVIAEVIDGEVIILNFDSGNYYSLNQTGLEIWQRLQAGHTAQSIIEALVRLYDSPLDAMQQATVQLLSQLEQEGLIVTGAAPPSLGTTVAAAATATTEQIFDPPLLQKYTDLANLLLLDPIHDVDEAGWPHLPK